jgi:cyclase
MLRPRIIPCLLVKNGGLVKTVQFGKSKYVGDPLNAVRIFNEKVVDELMVVDIDATVHSLEPDYDLIKNLASECRMPLCYGGGIKTVEQIEKLVSLGVEKVAISSAAVPEPKLLTDAAKRVGSQSVVAVMDVKKKRFGKQYEVYTHNGNKATGLDPVELAGKVESFGAGEVVINSIDQDGVMKGYDFHLVEMVRNATKLPITVLGGAGSINDIACLIRTFGILGAAAGSLFVFKGKYRAVLINYPDPLEKENLILQSLNQTQ